MQIACMSSFFTPNKFHRALSPFDFHHLTHSLILSPHPLQLHSCQQANFPSALFFVTRLISHLTSASAAGETQKHTLAVLAAGAAPRCVTILNTLETRDNCKPGRSLHAQTAGQVNNIMRPIRQPVEASDCGRQDPRQTDTRMVL